MNRTLQNFSKRFRFITKEKITLAWLAKPRNSTIYTTKLSKPFRVYSAHNKSSLKIDKKKTCTFEGNLKFRFKRHKN